VSDETVMQRVNRALNLGATCSGGMVALTASDLRALVDCAEALSERHALSAYGRCASGPFAESDAKISAALRRTGLPC
jgi:hypothetical protein